MQTLKWAVNKEQAAYLKQRQNQNLQRCKHSRAEGWMLEKLRTTKKKMDKAS
jgi:hypothetical protein